MIPGRRRQTRAKQASGRNSAALAGADRLRTGSPADDDLDAVRPAFRCRDSVSGESSAFLSGVEVRLAMDGERPCAASVVSSNDGLLVLRPLECGGAISELAPGSRIRVLRPSRDAAYACRAVVVKTDGDGLLHLRQESGEPERLQRRNHFRMRVQFPMIVSGAVQQSEEPQDDRVHPESSQTDLSPVEEMKPDPDGKSGDRTESHPGPEHCSDVEDKIIRAFLLLDLSAGGCLCKDPDSFLEVGRTYSASLQLNGKEGPLALVAKVVRSTGGEAGLSFDDLKEKDRERIMCALFREYRRRRASETSRGRED